MGGDYTFQDTFLYFSVSRKVLLMCKLSLQMQSPEIVDWQRIKENRVLRTFKICLNLQSCPSETLSGKECCNRFVILDNL